MNTNTVTKDSRTEAQRQADEAIAAAAESGDWTGFEREELLGEDGAVAILAHAKQQAAAPSGVLNQPFRWKNNVYRILRCDYTQGEAVAEVVPPDEELREEIKRRMQADRFHHLAYCQGFGFACFPEDYARYRD